MEWYVEVYEVVCVVGDYVVKFVVNVFSCSVYGGFNCFVCCIEEEFCKLFEDLLNMGGVGFLEIGDGESDVNIGDVVYDFVVG